jgi:hypothetical protein
MRISQYFWYMTLWSESEFIEFERTISDDLNILIDHKIKKTCQMSPPHRSFYGTQKFVNYKL